MSNGGISVNLRFTVLLLLILITGISSVAQQWYPLGPSVTTDEVKAQLGLVSALWVDKSGFNRVCAGSNTGGIFSTTDGGKNWASISADQVTTGVLAIEADPENEKQLYIGTGHWGFNRYYGQGVLTSPDAGRSWEKTGLGTDVIPSNGIVQELKFHLTNHDTLYALVNTEFKGKTLIYRSPDKANNWDIVYEMPGEELFDIVQSQDNPDLIVAAGSMLLVSRDAGTTWDDLTKNLDIKRNSKVARLCAAFTKTSPERLIVFLESYDTGTPQMVEQGMFISSDYGATFKRLFTKYLPMVSYWKMELQTSYAEPDEFYLGGIWLYKYKISGDTALYMKFDNHFYHKDVRDLLVFKGKDCDILFMGNDGGVSRSDDGAETWYDISRNGLQNTQFHNITLSENSNMIYCGPQDGNLCFYNRYSGEWWKEGHIGDAYSGLIDYDNPSIVYMVTLPRKSTLQHQFLLKSFDGGYTFNYRQVPDTTEQGRYNVPVAMHPKDSKTLYAGLKNVWWSNDGAETWSRLSNFNIGGKKIQALEVSPSDPSQIVICFEDPTWGNDSIPKLFITRDNGVEWHDITPRGTLSLAWGAVSDILIHPRHPDTIYLTIDRKWPERRVYASYDGGATWNNFSEGIPVTPVNAIRYFKGGDYDMFFIATDEGVYYRDDNTGKWVTFGEGLPVTIVSDIQIDYKRKKLVAGTFGRGLWETTLCLPVADGVDELSGKLKWPEGKNLLKNIVLLPDCELTVTSRVEAGEGTSIKIMPGAQLILDGATITSNCEGLWEGIRVYGNSDYDSNLPQGIITLKNGARIENARFAIDLMEYTDEKGENPDRGGGIVLAENTTILNSARALYFRPAEGVNPSQFIGTDIITNEYLWPDMSSESVIILENRGIVFDGCSVRNNLSLGVLPSIRRGYGIYCFNSTISFNNTQWTDKTAEIRGFRQGIRAIASSPGYSIRVNGINSKVNYTGIYVAGYSLCELSNNVFEISPIHSNDTLEKPVSGIYIDHCDAYTVNSNKLKASTLGAGITPTVGIVINDCGENNNLLLNNSFTLFDYAILAQKSNRNNNGTSGLRFAYNTFQRNKYDICVTSYDYTPTTGVAYYQGAPGLTVPLTTGNIFSNNKEFPYSDFFNSGEKLVYTHSDNTAVSEVSGPLFFTNMWLRKTTDKIPVDSASLFDSNPENASTHLKMWQELLTDSEKSFQKEIDGGDTENLMNKAATVNRESSTGLYPLLRELDSRLSVGVITELLKNQLFFNSMLMDVLVANPIIFRNEYLFEYLYARDPRMPGYQLRRLNNIADRYGMTEDLESRLQNTAAFRDHFMNGELLRLHQASDDEGLYSLLNSRGNFSDKLLIACNMIESGRVEEGTQNLAKMKSDFPEMAGGLDAISALASLLLPLTDTEGLSEEQYKIIASLCNEDPACIYANNALSHFGKSSYSEPYIYPNKAPSIVIPEFPDDEYTGDSFRLYPQPASSFLTMDYKFRLGPKDGRLEFVNMAGKIVKTVAIREPFGQKIIDISDLLPGTYVARLLDGKEKSGEQKILILR